MSENVSKGQLKVRLDSLYVALIFNHCLVLHTGCIIGEKFDCGGYVFLHL